MFNGLYEGRSESFVLEIDKDAFGVELCSVESDVVRCL